MGLMIGGAAPVAITRTSEAISSPMLANVPSIVSILRSAIEAMRDLLPGWFDEGSVPPSGESLDMAEQLLPALAKQSPTAAVFPSAAGFVVIEDSTAAYEYAVELRSRGEVFMARDAVNSEESVEKTVPFDRGVVLQFLAQA